MAVEWSLHYVASAGLIIDNKDLSNSCSSCLSHRTGQPCLETGNTGTYLHSAQQPLELWSVQTDALGEHTKNGSPGNHSHSKVRGPSGHFATRSLLLITSTITEITSTVTEFTSTVTEFTRPALLRNSPGLLRNWPDQHCYGIHQHCYGIDQTSTVMEFTSTVTEFTRPALLRNSPALLRNSPALPQPSPSLTHVQGDDVLLAVGAHDDVGRAVSSHRHGLARAAAVLQVAREDVAVGAGR